MNREDVASIIAAIIAAPRITGRNVEQTIPSAVAIAILIMNEVSKHSDDLGVENE